MPKEACVEIHKNMKEYLDMWSHWMVEDVLSVYTNPVCENV